MKYTDFAVEAILAGQPLTAAEREFLVRDTPHFEECSYSEAELQAMNDRDLMRAAFDAWADYAQGQV